MSRLPHITNPRNAYTFFVKEMFEQAKKEHDRELIAWKNKGEKGAKPERRDFKQINSTIGYLWKKMNEEEKKPYYEKAKQDKTRFEDEKKQAGIVVTKKKKRRAIFYEPKKPRTAYNLFDQEKRVKIREKMKQKGTLPPKYFGKISQKLSKKWKALPENKKQWYMRLAEADKVRYKEQMARFEELYKEANEITDDVLPPSSDDELTQED